MTEQSPHLEPGIYYQDVLADGSYSVLRQNFPKLSRTSFDKRPPVVRTVKIEVIEIFSELQLTEEATVVDEVLDALEKFEDPKPTLDMIGAFDPVLRRQADALFKKDS